MNESPLTQYNSMAEFALMFLSRIALDTSRSLFDQHISPEVAWVATTEIVWNIAQLLDGELLGELPVGRRVTASLGLVAEGSRSAFATPFIEQEIVVTAGRLSLHDYVHEAVDRAKTRFNSRAQGASAA